MFRSRYACTALAAVVLLMYIAPAQAGVTVAVGDLAHRGQNAIITVQASGEVDVVTQNSDGSFALVVYTLSDIADPSSVTVADVNGDGWPDVIVTDANDAATGLHVLLNNRDGTLAPEAVYPSGAAGDPGPQAVAVADVNGDGRPDLVTANGAGDSVSVLLADAKGGFAPAADYATGANPVALVVADLNADGLPDIVTSNSGDGTLSVLLNKGAGSFGDAASVTVGAGPVFLSVADVNGDGKPDLLVADRDDDTAGVLFGHGDGSFAPTAFYTTGSAPSWIATLDLDASGKPGIVTDNYADGSVSVFANNGDGSFAPQQLFYPNYGSNDTVVMDVPDPSGAGGNTPTPSLVSVDLQVSSVVVTTPVSKSESGGGRPTQRVLPVKGGSIAGDTGKGAFDLLCLLVLGGMFLRKRFV